MDVQATLLGAPVAHMHGPEHVTGRTRFAADVDLPGRLWGTMRRRPHPHAHIRRLDASAAWRVPGGKAVVTGPDAPGPLLGQVLRDMPVLCWDRVRYRGDRVAVVAAETPAAAEACWRLDVDDDVWPAVFDPRDAMRPEAPLLHDDVASDAGAPLNVLATDVPHGQTRLTWATGDVGEGCRQAEVMREHSCAVPSRHQGSLEPCTSVLAIDHDGRSQAGCARNAPVRARVQRAQAPGLREEHIRVHVVAVGGAVGGQGDARDLPVADLLAQRARRPVTIVLRSGEALTASHPPHPTVGTSRSGMTRDGHLTVRAVRTVHARRA
jgi:CO/xanthine dehydrogenase Mo-binding subunit